MRIEFLDKTRADAILPKLYRILYTNMERIAPVGGTYEEGMGFWISCIKPALDNEFRHILLIDDDDDLAGYFQYSVYDGIFMMEDIQFRDEYKGTGLFAALYRYLIAVIPQDTQFVEAYANQSNEKSIRVLTHLGLEVIGENKNGKSWHFRGDYQNLVKRYENKTINDYESKGI